MASSPLETIAKHDGCLDVLCCLVGDEPLAVPQLSARTGRSLISVGHCVRLLDSFGLVEATGDSDSGDPLYVATLDRHPAWVQQAVEEHRERD
jgi:hypothetical protein